WNPFWPACSPWKERELPQNPGGRGSSSPVKALRDRAEEPTPCVAYHTPPGEGAAVCAAPSRSQMALPPVQDRLETGHPVAGQTRTRQLVSLTGKEQHLHLTATPLQGHEQALCLLHRATPVLLGMDDQHRKVDLVGVRERTLGLPGLLRPVQRVWEERSDVGGGVQTVDGVDRAFTDRGTKPLTMVRSDPRCHETAMRAAHHPHPGRVHTLVLQDRVEKSEHI